MRVDAAQITLYQYVGGKRGVGCADAKMYEYRSGEIVEIGGREFMELLVVHFEHALI